MICSRNCAVNDLLAIPELCTYYIEYKNIKFKAINFSGQTNFKYFMQISFCDFVKIWQKFLPLPMLEITTKSTYFLHAKKKIPILCIELQTNENVKGCKTLHLTPSGKKFANYKDFFKNCG